MPDPTLSNPQPDEHAPNRAVSIARLIIEPHVAGVLAADAGNVRAMNHGGQTIASTPWTIAELLAAGMLPGVRICRRGGAHPCAVGSHAHTAGAAWTRARSRSTRR